MIEKEKMASTLKYVVHSVQLENEINLRYHHAQSVKKDNFIAARTIQAWLRGIITRNHMRYLHAMSITIQRHWRGYRVRCLVESYVIQRTIQTWENYYKLSTTRIQAVWRGYWVRKTILDQCKMKRWLRSVYKKNERTLEQMKKFRYNQIKYTRNVIEQESMLWVLFILLKLHHLLMTQCQSGVVTKIDKTRFTAIEEMMHCLKYNMYISEKSKRPHLNNQEMQVFLLQGTYFARCEKEIQEYEKYLHGGTYKKTQYMHRKVLKVGECLTRRSFEEDLVLRKNVSCIKEIENFQTSRVEHDVKRVKLYKFIQDMECCLNNVHIKCPIHDEYFLK